MTSHLLLPLVLTAVITAIFRNNPDVIMLQEVMDDSLEILRTEMTSYEIFVANGEDIGIIVSNVWFWCMCKYCMIYILV